jgi:hypothetical protein
MGKYCRNCGNEMKDGARFCGKCGAAVAGAPAPQPAHTTPAVVNQPSPVKAVKRKGGCNTLCVVLAIVLVMQTATVALYGWPGFAVDKSWSSALQTGKPSGEIGSGSSRGYSGIKVTKKDYKSKPVVVNVGPENTVAKAGGITVDFGEFNLSEEVSLEIRDIGVKTDDENGFSAHCYDFSLENVEEFPTYVTITLPYEKVQNASDRLFVQYYNDSTHAWEMMYSVLNESAGTITFYTDHFSTFGVFDLFLYEKGYNSGPLSKVHFNSLMLDDLINNCEADSETFFAMLRNNSPEDSGLVKVALDSFGLTNNLLSGVDYPMNLSTTISETLTSSAEGLFTKEFGKIFGKIGAGLTAVKVGLSWYESGEVTKAFKDNKYDLIELGLSTAGGALGAAPLTVAAGGVWLMGMADEEITNLYNKGYDSPKEHVYQLFTWDYVSYSNSAKKFGCLLPNDMPARALLDEEMADAVIVNEGNTWAWLLQREFVKYRDNPQKMFEAIDMLLDDYASAFWKLKPSVRKMIAEDIHRADSWREPSAEEITKLKEDLKAILRYRLRKLFACIYERCILDAKQRLLWDIQDLQAKMNTVTEFSVYAMDEEEKEIPLSKTEYKDYIAAFAVSPSDKPTIWSWSPGSKNNAEFACTLFNYFAIGAPSYVKFYKTWEDQVEDKTVFTLSFTYSAPTVKLKIVNEGLSLDDLVGIYETTVSVDSESESHTFYLEKHGSGLIISDKTDSLEMKYDPSTGVATSSKVFPVDEDKLTYSYRFTFKCDNGTISITGTSTAYLNGDYQATANYQGYKVN